MVRPPSFQCVEAATLLALTLLSGQAQGDSIDVAPVLSSVAFGYTTLFKDEAFDVSGTLVWESLEEDWVNGDELYWRLYLNDELVRTGTTSLNASRALPSELDFGSERVYTTGTVSVRAEISLDSAFANTNVTSSSSAKTQAINAGASLVPLIMVLFIALTLRKVEVALLMGVFIGACMVYGTLMEGFKATFVVYLLNAVVDTDHQFVVLFSLFLSGLVGMMQRTGGTQGLTRLLVRFARTPRWAQVIAFCSGVFLFFDDYTNILVIGTTMRPILDNFVCREKTAWITDATSAPIASLSPVSSWVGFEVSLIQDELDAIVEANNGTVPDGLPTSGYAVFLQTIAYRYYPIYLLAFQVCLALMQRDFGPMLIAERKVRVTGRKDGGDGGTDDKDTGMKNELEVKKGTPIRAYNMLIPVAILILLVFWILVQTGRSSVGDDASFLDVIQGADSFSALLLGTVGTAVCSMVLYSVQFVKDGEVVPPLPRHVWGALREFVLTKEDNNSGKLENESLEPGSVEPRVADQVAEQNEDSDLARPLMGPLESFENFIRALVTLFPAIVVLVLAWTVGALMKEVGCDRLFARAITSSSFDVGMLPTITFIVSAFMSLAIGSSWSVMTIVFPLVTQPAWEAAPGDLNILYGTIAAVLAGSVMGDHASPISDTTVLSCSAARCDLTQHVRTQAPYALTVGILSVLCGTLSVGTAGYSTGAGVGVGIIAVIIVCFAIGAPVLCTSGRYDIFTELYVKITRDPVLIDLKEDTARVAHDGGVISLDDMPGRGRRQADLAEA